MSKIRQNQLAQKMAGRTNLYNSVQIEGILKIFKETVMEEVTNGNEVVLHGFGKFEVFVRHGRHVMDPQKNVKMWVADKPVIKFRPGHTTKNFIKDNYVNDGKKETIK